MSEKAPVECRAGVITGQELEWLRTRAAEADDLRRKMANMAEEVGRLKDAERRLVMVTEEVLHLRAHAGSLVKLLDVALRRLADASECLGRIAEKDRGLAPQRVAPDGPTTDTERNRG